MSTVNPEIQQIQQAINETQVEAERQKVGEQEVRLETGQVYKGTPSQIQEALKKAQEEASRTLTKRNEELESLRAQLAQRPEVKVEEPTNKNAYFEQWAKDPSKATIMALAQEMGIDPEEYVRITKANLENSSVNNASAEFTRRRPDFPNDAASSAVLKRHLQGVTQRFGIKSAAALTADHLELAFQDAIRAGDITPQQVMVSDVSQINTPLPNLRGTSAPPTPETQLLATAASMPLLQLEAMIKRLRMQQG